MRAVSAAAAVVVALLAVPGRCYIADHVGRSLSRMLDIRTVANDTGVRVPGYMYELYGDAENRRYDAIRNVRPSTESLGTYTQLVYDLSALESTERVEKAVLRLESAGPGSSDVGRTVNVSFYTSAAAARPASGGTYLGSASMGDTLDLAGVLGSRPLAGQLVVRAEPALKSSMGLVLYSTTAAAERTERGHELAALLYETAIKRRRRRSVTDNEVDGKRKHPAQGPKDKSKRRKKKKGPRGGKLRAVDDGNSIVFTNADQCRMERLVLNFADIGWEDWVIYPKGFETNYCAGGCLFPLGKGSKPTNHATVQSLARSFGRLWDIPEPSCVPDTLAPLTLLYMDRANHVLLKSYPDMRVLSCSCK